MSDATAAENVSIFVGNIPTNATAEELLSFFNKDGKVAITNAKVVQTKNSRPDSRVFAFVEVKTAGEVQKVIDLFHDKEMNGNKLVVQAALPPRKRAPKPEGAASGGAANAGGAAAGADGEDAPAKKKRTRRSRGRKTAGGEGGAAAAAPAGGAPAAAAAGAGGASAAANNADGNAANKPRRARAPRKTGENNGNGNGNGNNNANNGNSSNNNNNNAGNNNAGGDAGARPARPRRERKPAGENNNNNNNNNTHEKIDPTSTLFVANLPFDCDDDALKAFMTTGTGKVLQARIVRVRYNNRSKGFGFVSFDSTAARDAALAAKNQQKMGERVISVNVAKEEKPERPAKKESSPSDN